MSGRVIGTYCLGFFAAAITSILALVGTARTMPPDSLSLYPKIENE
jgi:hypothetical protein